MSGQATLPRREAAEELAALLHMTRFMADIVPKLVDDPYRLKQHLHRLEAELRTELELKDAMSPCDNDDDG